MVEQIVILLRDNQFGISGPQSGDKGVSYGTFFIPNMDTRWHSVVFDDFPDEEYSCPGDAIQILTN